MKQYKKRNAAEMDYTNEKYTKCWTCKNACGGCSWSREFIPVNCWKAEKRRIAANVGYEETYMIYDCPEYKKG